MAKIVKDFELQQYFFAKKWHFRSKNNISYIFWKHFESIFAVWDDEKEKAPREILRVILLGHVY